MGSLRVSLGRATHLPLSVAGALTWRGSSKPSAGFISTGHDPTPRFPPPGPPGRVPRLHRYYQGAPTSCRPSRRTSFSSFGGTAFVACLFAPAGGRRLAPAGRGVDHRDSPDPACFRRKRQDLPGSWGTLVNVPCSRTPADRNVRPLTTLPVLPSTFSTASAPRLWVLSRLNHTARSPAVYASQDGSLRHHARLAPGWWPPLAGRDFNPQGSIRRFQSAILPPSPGFPWRKPNEAIAAPF